MSLSIALSAATSSLRTIQTNLAVASSNIANSDTDGYSVKSTVQSNTVSSGQGTGVTIKAIQSRVDASLVRTIVGAAATSGAAATTTEYLQSLSDALGTLSGSGSGGQSLSSAVADAVAALEELASTPESTTLKTQAVMAFDDAASALRTTSATVQSLRQDADSGIEEAVASVNDILTQLSALNDSVVRARLAGQPTADLDDQRNSLLQSLSGYMDITYFSDSTGAIKVYTGTGEPLLTSVIHPLSYESASGVDAGTTYPGGFSGIMLNGKDITTTLKSGSVAALVTMRDTTLPAFQAELDSQAASLMDTLNSLHNGSTAVPAPSSLTGTVTGLSGTDSLSGSGTLRVVVSDSSAATVSALDIDLSAVATVDDLLTQLNSISGLSASLDSAGRLVVQATGSGTGVSLSGGTLDGEGASARFGLNDLLTGTGATDIAVRANILSSPSLLATGSVSTASSLAAGDVAVTGGSGDPAQAMADALAKADISTAAADLVASVGTLLTQAKASQTAAETTLTTLTDRFSSKYGVNVDEESARITDLENAYSASAQIISAVNQMFESLLQAVK